MLGDEDVFEHLSSNSIGISDSGTLKSSPKEHDESGLLHFPTTPSHAMHIALPGPIYATGLGLLVYLHH